MRGSNFIQKLLTAIKAAHGERGTAMVEYAGMVAGIAIVVVASLVFLGGAVGGSWSDVVINAPLKRRRLRDQPAPLQERVNGKEGSGP